MEVEKEVTVEGQVMCPHCNRFFTATITQEVSVEVEHEEGDGD